jgi:hypothetical protein
VLIDSNANKVLCQRFLELFNLDRLDNPQFRNAFFIAAWHWYRHEPDSFVSQHLALLELVLLWAARSAFNLNHVFSESTSTPKILEHLKRVSEKICREEAGEKILFYLWSGFFAPLLAKLTPRDNLCMTPEFFSRLAASAKGVCNNEWPIRVRSLVRICARQASKQEIDSVKDWIVMWNYIPNEPALISGLLLSQELHVDLQVLLLQSPIKISEELLRTNLKEVLKNLRDGLAKVAHPQICEATTRERILRLKD